MLAARLADMTVISLLTLVMGLLLGAVMGFLVARNRQAAKAADLAARASVADERARAAEQRTALVDGQLAERFQALSAQALDASTRRFLEMAEGRLNAANAKAAGELDNRRAAVEGLVGPLKETLARVEAQLAQHGGVNVGDVMAFIDRMKADFVGGPVDHATFDATACQPGTKALRMVVSTIALRARRAAKFRSPHYKRIF